MFATSTMIVLILAELLSSRLLTWLGLIPKSSGSHDGVGENDGYVDTAATCHCPCVREGSIDDGQRICRPAFASRDEHLPDDGRACAYGPLNIPLPPVSTLPPTCKTVFRDQTFPHGVA